MSARTRRERFQRAVSQGRVAFSVGLRNTDNPYKPTTSGSGISHGAWAHGYASALAEYMEARRIPKTVTQVAD